MRADLRLPLLLLLVAIAYVGTTTNRGVTDYDEAYYVQPAMRMAADGDWVTPYANGVRFLEKPPFLYWVTAASIRAFGLCESVLRLPTALAMIALVWVMARMGRHAAGSGEGGMAAGIAGLSAALSVGAYLFTRETLHDVWLVLFLALAMYGFLQWRLDAQRPLRPALLFYAAMAGAVMCKSLVGIAFPVGIAVLFFIISRERPRWRSLHLFWGAAVFLALTVPWHWLAAVRNEGFLNFFFVGEQFLRFFGHRWPPVLWSVPLWVFWGMIPVWFFPWTAFLPAAFSRNRSRNPGEDSARVVMRLAVAWAIVILGFFSFSARLEHYVFPALPALGLMAAVAFGRADNDRAVLWGFRGLAAVGALVLSIGVVIGAGIAAGYGLPSSSTGPTDRLAETDFSILAEMPAEIMQRLLAPAAATVLLLPVGFFAALLLEMRRRRKAAVLCVAAVMMGICGMTHWSLNICEDLISSKSFGLAIAREARPGDRLVVLGDYESANSLNFYQPLTVEVAEGTAYALLPGLKYPDAPKVLLTPAEFHGAWNGPDRLFVLLPAARLGELNPTGVEVMRRLHRVVVRNR